MYYSGDAWHNYSKGPLIEFGRKLYENICEEGYFQGWQPLLTIHITWFTLYLAANYIRK